MSPSITAALGLTAFAVVSLGIAYLVDRRDRRRNSFGKFDELKRRVERLEEDVKKLRKEQP